MAAAKFSKEANLQPQQENTSIKARQQIQEHIHKGHIKQAIEALNDLDPEVSKFYLFFSHLEPCLYPPCYD